MNNDTDTIKVTIEGADNDEPQVRRSTDEDAGRLAASLAERDEWVRRADQAELTAVESKYETARTKADAAKREHSRAFEAGDIEAMSSAIDAMALAAADAKQLEARHENLKRAAARPADPVEAFISSKSAPSQKWLREHRDLVEEPRKF